MPITDLLHPTRYTDPTTAAQRLAKCNTCPNKNRIGRCRLCGCFVRLKTRLTTEACPAGKWGAVVALLLLLWAQAPAQSFTAPFSVVTSDQGVDIYHIPVSVHITQDEILIGKKGSDMDVLFAHILHTAADTAANTITYTTEQGTVVLATEGDCMAVTWEGGTFTWRIYSHLPQWVQVENKK